MVENAHQPAGKCQFSDPGYAASSNIRSSRSVWMEMRQVRECLRVMAVLRIPVVDLTGDTRASAGLVCPQPAPSCQPAAAAAVWAKGGDKMPSFHIDLHSGRGLSEVDYLNGAVVRFGERHQGAPVNYFLNETLSGNDSR
jgi:2-dehydropantoate 2-reductase